MSGILVYLPMGMMSGRYSMPAVWGLDILFALLLTRLTLAPASGLKAAAWAGVTAGLAAVAVAGVGKQEKFAARAKMLWQVVHHVEATAPPGARVAWVSGPDLNVEEGIHVGWHLFHRGRGDIRIGLYDRRGDRVERVELPPPDGPPDLVVSGVPIDGREPERTFAVSYWFGRKEYRCYFSRP